MLTWRQSPTSRDPVAFSFGACTVRTPGPRVAAAQAWSRASSAGSIPATRSGADPDRCRDRGHRRGDGHRPLTRCWSRSKSSSRERTLAQRVVCTGSGPTRTPRRRRLTPAAVSTCRDGRSANLSLDESPRSGGDCVRRRGIARVSPAKHLAASRREDRPNCSWCRCRRDQSPATTTKPQQRLAPLERWPMRPWPGANADVL